MSATSKTVWLVLFALGIGGFFLARKSHRDLASVGSTLTLNVEVGEACGLGALDALDIDVYYGGVTLPILLTAESGTTLLGVKELTAEDLSRSSTMLLPVDSTKGKISFYLCTDPPRTKRCSDKAKLFPSEVIVADTRAAKKDLRFNHPPGRTFFTETLPQVPKDGKIRLALSRHGGKCP